MWMQAQNLVVAGAFEWDGSVVMVLVLRFRRSPPAPAPSA